MGIRWGKWKLAILEAAEFIRIALLQQQLCNCLRRWLKFTIQSQKSKFGWHKIYCVTKPMEIHSKQNIYFYFMNYDLTSLSWDLHQTALLQLGYVIIETSWCLIIHTSVYCKAFSCGAICSAWIIGAFFSSASYPFVLSSSIFSFFCSWLFKIAGFLFKITHLFTRMQSLGSSQGKSVIWQCQHA